MDLASHFRVIAQNWLRILVISLVVAIVVFLLSGLRAEVFEAKVVLQVNPAGANANEIQDIATFKAQQYAELEDTKGILTPVIRGSGLDLTLDEAGERTGARPVGDIGFLEVRATGPSRSEAQSLARYMAKSYEDYAASAGAGKIASAVRPIRLELSQAEQQLAELAPDSPDRLQLQLRINSLVDQETQARATPIDALNSIGAVNADRDPVSPKPLRDAIVALLISLVIVSELTVLAHFTGDRFSGTEDSEEVARLTGLPIIAKIPRGESIEVIEAFRVLRTNLMVLEGAGRPRTVAIVSANPSAGKTFTATHLAESAAGLEEKVVLIDGDLRKPTVHERLGIPRAPGLSAVLQGGDLTTALTRVPDNPYLRVLPSGAPVQDASGVLGARSFRHVLDALRAVRLVIVDTPPANLFADAMAVASQCDATIFVLDVKTSRRRAVRQTVETLERAGANLIGVVINRAAVAKTASYYEG